MPLMQFCVSSPTGEFICFVWGPIYEGTVLTYDPVFKGSEWITVCSTMQDLSMAEEMLVLPLCNLVPCSPDMQSERLNKFGEDRGAHDTGGEGGSGHNSNEGSPRKSNHKSDGEGQDINSPQNIPDDGSGMRSTHPHIKANVLPTTQ